MADTGRPFLTAASRAFPADGSLGKRCGKGKFAIQGILLLLALRQVVKRP